MKKHIMKWFPSMLLLGCLLLQLSANAAGPTNEEESIADYNSGRYPLVVSPDGEWRVHVDEQNVLQRTNLANKNIAEQITLPVEARAISASLTASKVAFTDGNCIGVVSFTGDSKVNPVSGVNSVAQLKWLGSVCPYQTTSPGDPASRAYGTFSIAMSKDGKFVAVPGNPVIKILDSESGRIVSVVPTGLAHVLHMRFIDEDRKLLVVQAILGEQWESPAEGSDMQFAVWDLQSKTLFNFHNTRTTGTLLSDDLLWNFSDKTGLLWAINTNGAPWESADKLAPIHPYLINLKQCGASVSRQLNLPQTDWVDFAADPLGRWIAVVESVFEPTTKQVKSHLVVRNSFDGALLTQWPLDSEIRSLTSSQDGKRIYATTAGQPAADGLRYTRIMWIFKGGGTVMEFNLDETIKGLAPAQTIEWPAQRCLIEDEISDARNISIDSKPHLLFGKLHEEMMQNSIPSLERYNASCSGDATSFYDTTIRSWGGNGEHLWFDRRDSLERINLVDGHIEQTIPTPRSPTRCSIPLYEREQFVSWGGDTIMLHPFSRTVRTEKVLAQKPGWTATSLRWLGDQFRVRWINDRNSQSDENDDSHPARSALVILYSDSGAELKQTEEFVSDSEEQSPVEIEEGVDEISAYQDRITPKKSATQTLPNYEWSFSYSGSVRARLISPTSQGTKTVFWYGLNLEMPLFCEDGAYNYFSAPVIGKYGAIGVLPQPSDVIVFDAEKQQRHTGFATSNVSHAEWYPSHRTLVVGTYVKDFTKPILRSFKLGVTNNKAMVENKAPTEIADICQCIGKTYQAMATYRGTPRIANDVPTVAASNAAENDHRPAEQTPKVDSGESIVQGLLNRFSLVGWVAAFIFLVAGAFFVWRKLHRE